MLNIKLVQTPRKSAYCLTSEGVYIIITLSVIWYIPQKLFEGMRYFMTAFKKPLSCILAILMVIVFTAAVPISAFADSDGLGEQLTLSEEELLNKRAEGDFEYIRINNDSEAEIVSYTGNDTVVTVPSKIGGLSLTSVGNGCFAGNENITTVKLTSAVTELKPGAFMNCTALKEVKKADSLTKIGMSAFEGCVSMTEYTIPDSVTVIPERCFYGCSALAEVKYHKNLKNVAKDAFTGTAWENNAPDGALSLGRVLYSYKGDVKDLVIGDGIEIIEKYVFIGCTDIKTVTFGDDVEEIGLYAFQNCTNLEKITCGSAVSLIDAGAFKGCSSLKEADFSGCTVASIDYEAFAGCTSLTDVKLSETITDIEDRAFADTKLKTMDFGKNMKNLGSNVFANIETLESFTVAEKNKNFSAQDGVLYSKNGKVLISFPAAKTGAFELPQKVEEIRNGALRGSDIESISFTEDTALKTIGAYAFENSKIKSISLPESVTTINNSAFKNADALSEVKLGGAVTYIGASAFEGCKALSSIELPGTLRDIAAYAFKNAGLTSVKTGNGVVRIDTGAFYGNENLKELSLGEKVSKLGDESFAFCKSLESVLLPASLENFSASAFSGCSALKDIKVAEDNAFFKNTVSGIYSKDGKELVILAASGASAVAVAEGTEVICANAFTLCDGVTSISFPSTLRNIEEAALDSTAWFKNSAGGAVYAGGVLYRVLGNVATLAVADGTTAVADNAVNNETVTAVILPVSLEFIGKEAFKGASLKSVAIPKNVVMIDDCAFENVATLEKAEFSEGSALTTLGSAAFKGCAALKNIVLPEGVTAIPTDLFAGCAALESVTLGSVESIGKYAFSGCVALKEITLPATLTVLDPLSFLGCLNLEAVNVGEGNAAYKTLDGAVVAADENGEWNKLVLFPQGKDGEYKIPDGITEIGDRAFYDCDGLTSVTFCDGLKKIGDEAFFDCDALRSVNVPESVRKIGSYAFGSCNELREFVVNSNLTSYDDNAFDGCFYFNYDAVTIDVPDNSGSILGIVIGVLVAIGVIWFLVYKRKEKKLEKQEAEKKAAQAK